MIRWLHISDLHFGSGGMATEMLRDELPRYLRSKGLCCDYVFCTGDVRTANVAHNEFSDEMAEYVRTLCSAVGVPVENFFIVPGNHDVDIYADGRTEAVHRVMFNRSGYYKADNGIIEPEDMTAMMAGEKGFVKFLQKIYPSERVSLYGNSAAPHFNVETPDFNILHIDSTLSYCPGQDKVDFVVGTEALYRAVKQINPQKPTVLLTHYPLFALLQDERSRISTMLQKNGIRLWLAGHEHEHVLQKIHYVDSLQAGELRLEDGAKASVLVGEYDERSERCRITAHAWFDEGWAQYPIVDSDNKTHPERYECFLGPAGDPAASVEIRMCREANADYYYRLPDTVEKALLPCIDADGELTSLQKLLSDTWGSGTPHIILLADGGMGKTTMLLDYCREACEPVLYIPAEHLAALKVSIEQYCVGKIYGGDGDLFRESLSNGFSAPTLTLFIDGLNEVDSDAERRFIMEIQRLNLLKGLRIVVSSRSNFTLRYSMPGYRAVGLCPLEDKQIRGYFSSSEWRNVLSSGSLHRLLQNPMMVTVYKEICSVIDEYRNVEFLDWILPVRNVTDLFHDYYVAQLALMMKRSSVDGKQMMLAWSCINRVLPALAYSFELSHNIHLENSCFRDLLSDVLHTVSIDSGALIPIQEHYREASRPNLDYLKVLDLLADTLRLLHRDGSTVGFPHQMHRDYLSARWIVISSTEPDAVESLWNTRNLPSPVMTHIRQGSGRYWENGLACKVHEAGRGRFGGNAFILVNNLLQCFPYSESSGIPDYSGLDLRGLTLPDNQSAGSGISLKDAYIDNVTLGLISGDAASFTVLCISEDRKYVAAVDSKKCGLYIFDLQTEECCFTYSLGRRVSKMAFCGNGLYIVVSAEVHLFRLDAEWRFVGVIGEGKGLLHKLKAIVEKDGALFLYYNNRLVKYCLADCSRLEIVNGKFSGETVDGIDLYSLLVSSNGNLSSFRKDGVAASAGDESFRVVSYRDGRLVAEWGNDTVAVLSRGVTRLLDASVSGDGCRAATLSFSLFGNERKIQLWDLDAQKKMADLTCPGTVFSIHLSDTGDWIMCEDAARTWVLCCETGEVRWFDEHFVSNHMNQILFRGDCVLRKRGESLFLFDLRAQEEKAVESPVPDPGLVCFMNDGTLAAANKSRRSVFLHSIRDGRNLTLSPDGSEILAVQPLKNQPFIAVACKDGIISMYHTGTGQRVRKLQTGSNPRIVAVHRDKNLIADTDGHHSLETHNYYEKKGRGGKMMGWWYDNPYQPGHSEPAVSGDILDIAFNSKSNRLVAVLSNGCIMFFDDNYCKYHDSFGIILAFDVNAYDFRGCQCPPELKKQLLENGAVLE